MGERSGTYGAGSQSSAVAAPAGTRYRWFWAPGGRAVLLHEAVGRQPEGDFNRRDICGEGGQIVWQVALRAACTVVDDGTMMNRRGLLLSMMKVRRASTTY